VKAESRKQKAEEKRKSKGRRETNLEIFAGLKGKLHSRPQHELHSVSSSFTDVQATAPGTGFYYLVPDPGPLVSDQAGVGRKFKYAGHPSVLRGRFSTCKSNSKFEFCRSVIAVPRKQAQACPRTMIIPSPVPPVVHLIPKSISVD
jgi:hypothetical protein